MHNHIKSVALSNEFLIFLSFLLLQAIFPRPLLLDADVGWHLKAGEYILKHLEIPAYDPWSFSSNQQWYNISWLWDVVSFLLFKALGPQKTMLFNSALYAGLLALGYRLLLIPTQVSMRARINAIIIAALSLWPFAFFRPHIVGLYAIVLCMWLFKRESRYILFLPIMLIWQNMHGSFVLGYTIAGAFTLQNIYNKEYSLKKIVTVTLLALAILPINPLGLNIITAITRTLDSDISLLILEWKPFQFGQVFGLSIFVGIVIMLGNINTRKAPIAERLLLFFWLFAGLVSLRYLILAQFIGLSLLAIWLDSAQIQPMKDYKLAAVPRLTLVTLLTILIIIKQMGLALDIIPSTRSTGAENAALFIKNNYPGLNIFNDYNSGGHLIFHAGNTNKIFVDSRAGTAYNEEVLSLAIGFIEAKPDWTKAFEFYKIDGIIMPEALLQRIDLKMFFSKWKRVYTDKNYIILVRPDIFKGCTSHNSRVGRRKECSVLNIYKQQIDEPNLEVGEIRKQ